MSKLSMIVSQVIFCDNVDKRQNRAFFIRPSFKDSKRNRFPTNKEVINYIRLLIFYAKRKVLSKQITNIVAEELIGIWQSEGVPTIALRSIKRMIENLYEKYQKVNKIKLSERNDISMDFYESLCDITKCKCANDCICCRDHKIPVKERQFVEDQRNERKLSLGNVDNDETTRRRKIEERYERALQRQEAVQEEPTVSLDVESSSSDTESSSETSFEDSQQSCNRQKLMNTARAADRYRVSNRAVAAICTAYELDRQCGTGTAVTITHSKVWRARHKIRRQAAKERRKYLCEKRLTSLYFDGKNDDTRTTLSGEMEVEEHIVVLSEPEGYVTHFTPESKKSLAQHKELKQIEADYNADITVLGCDGAAINTGRKGGICLLFERSKGRPVHWFICQLHSNELNLRHLFTELDGVSSGPNSFKGILGKRCRGSVHKKATVQFAAVPGHVVAISEECLKGLSDDQRLLHMMATAIQSGSISANVSCKKIGRLNHARWLTLAIRLMRIYVATESPSRELQQLVRFLVNHYVPMWFQIKQHSCSRFGARNVHRSIELLSTLQEQTQSIVQKVIQRNSYWCHPEAVLLAMMCDLRKDVREQAVAVVKKCRQEANNKLRVYELPIVNFSATTYYNMFDWNTTTCTEPPLSAGLTEDELNAVVNEPMTIKYYPIHTQSVERAVRLVSQASMEVLGQEERHGHICSTIQHRHDYEMN